MRKNSTASEIVFSMRASAWRGARCGADLDPQGPSGGLAALAAHMASSSPRLRLVTPNSRLRWKESRLGPPGRSTPSAYVPFVQASGVCGSRARTCGPAGVQHRLRPALAATGRSSMRSPDRGGWCSDPKRAQGKPAPLSRTRGTEGLPSSRATETTYPARAGKLSFGGWYRRRRGTLRCHLRGILPQGS